MHVLVLLSTLATAATALAAAGDGAPVVAVLWKRPCIGVCVSDYIQNTVFYFNARWLTEVGVIETRH
jgi:hypothetical protein